MEWCIGPRPQVHLEKPPVKRPWKKRKKIGCPLEIPEIPYWKHQHFQEVLSKKNWRLILWSQRFFEQEWPYQPDTNRQQTSARKNQTEILVPRPRTTDSYQRRRPPHEIWKCKVLQQPCRNWGDMALQNGGFLPFPKRTYPILCESGLGVKIDSAPCAGVSWALNLLYTLSLQRYSGWTLHEILSIKSLVGRSLHFAEPILFPSGFCFILPTSCVKPVHRDLTRWQVWVKLGHHYFIHQSVKLESA